MNSRKEFSEESLFEYLCLSVVAITLAWPAAILTLMGFAGFSEGGFILIGIACILWIVPAMYMYGLFILVYCKVRMHLHMSV